MPSPVRTVVEMLQSRADQQPDNIAYIFVDRNGELGRINYGELDLTARAVGRYLQQRIEDRSRVLLMDGSGRGFIEAFFGCLYANMIAVPSYPPRPNRPMDRALGMITDCGAAAVVASEPVLTRLATTLDRTASSSSVLRICLEEARLHPNEGWKKPSLEGDAIAFLQYTSGSTSEPRGVMIRHRNILTNQDMIRRVFKTSSESTIVGWLPMHHDMGLIGNVLHPVYVGCPCVLMAPLAFLQTPVTWLRAITKYRATVSGGPNAAYDLCVDHIRESDKDALDLSSWSVAFNGSEPILHSTLVRFAAAFAGVGFRRTSFVPCYGLAETTLLVSGSNTNDEVKLAAWRSHSLSNELHSSSRNGDLEPEPLLGCGSPASDQVVVIADPESGRVCEVGETGEVLVSGPNVALGYWNRVALTRQVFQHYLPDGRGPFLRTGDLAFQENGELFIVGRIKELIVIRGENHFPNEIESTVRGCSPAFRRGSGAAFSADLGDGPGLVIVQEVPHDSERDFNSAITTIRNRVASQHGLAVDAVLLVKRGTVPKTSSGKVMRIGCGSLFTSGKLHPLAQWRRTDRTQDAELAAATSEGTLQDLVALFAQKVGCAVGDVRTDEPVSRYPIDSMRAAEIIRQIEVRYDTSLTVTAFLSDRTLQDLASHLRPRAANKRRGAPLERKGSFPLSHAQMALWFLQTMEPSNSTYHITRAMLIKGALDVDALRESLRYVVDRHRALRTTFVRDVRGPLQTIHDSMDAGFAEHDAASLTDEQLRRALEQAAEAPFSFENGPLLRFEVFHRAADRHILMLTVHHIIADLWSLGVLFDELGRCYAAKKSGATIVFSDTPGHYRDYVEFERQILASTEDELWRYWEKRLAGAPESLDLLRRQTSQTTPKETCGSLSFRVDGRLSEKVARIAEAQSVTPYIVLLSVFVALLHRYSGEEDIVVGSPASGRDSAEFASTVGYFINTLALRFNVSGSTSFADLLQQARTTVLGALDHQRYPFPLIVEKLRSSRRPGRNPLFQVMFAYQSTAFDSTSTNLLSSLALGQEGAQGVWGGMEVEVMPLASSASHFPLTLSMAEQGESLLGLFEYETGAFERDAIQRIAQNLISLLDSATEDPSAPLCRLDLLSREERNQLLLLSGQTTSPPPVEQSLHELIHAQMRRTPDRIGIRFEDQSITFEELDRQAEQVASRLIASGVALDEPVALIMERSPELIIGILGILKAGGAFLPIDATYPRQRIEVVLRDASPRVALTQRSLLPQIPRCGQQILCVEAQPDSLARSVGTVARPQAAADNCAYIIYTSGSTGTPKGTLITHGGIVNYLNWSRRAYDLEQGSGSPLYSSITFDLSLTALFGPLVAGTAVELLQEELGVDALLSAIREKKDFSFIKLTPSHLRLLAQQLGASDVRDRCRSLIVGGEALTAEDLAIWRANSPGTRVFNEYGPTETVVGCCVYEIPRLDEAKGQVPIGRPISNTKIYVLDQAFNPVPPGVAGELFVGGAGLARGYLNRPAATAEKFLPDPFSTSGGRLYRTGDSAWYAPDGTLHFLGRKDRQVKIRGFRIEPAEVECVLRDCLGVEAFVMGVERPGSDKCLVGYILRTQGQSVSDKELRLALKKNLPGFMVPSMFVFIDSWPLTASGKLDIRRLPPPESGRPRESEFVAPRNAIEHELTTIWKDLLRVDRVSVADNFFELGGHSLLIPQLVAAIRERLHIDLPMRSLFLASTVESLAETLTNLGCPEPGMKVTESDRLQPRNCAIKALSDYTTQVLPATPQTRDRCSLHD